MSDEEATLDDFILGAKVTEVFDTEEEEDGGVWTIFRFDNGCEMQLQGTILIVPPTVN